MRITEMVDSRPARPHTIVDTIFGLTPDRRARSGFVAAASIAFPRAVRARNHASNATVTGTTTIVDSWGPDSVSPAT